METSPIAESWLLFQALKIYTLFKIEGVCVCVCVCVCV